MKLDPRDRAALLWIFGVALAIRIVLAFATAAEAAGDDLKSRIDRDCLLKLFNFWSVLDWEILGDGA